MKPLNEDDRHIGALTVIGEARGEGEMGMRAVAWVICNRAVTTGRSVVDVCFQRLQFSCWNRTPDNVGNLREMAGALPSGHLYTRARNFIIEAFEPGAIDPTGGADHYHTTAVSPAWANPARVTAKIGSHVFYNL